MNSGFAELTGPIRVPLAPGLPLELVQEYLTASRTAAAEMAAACAAGDLERARVLGHRLKGTGRAYGFPYLTEAGAGIEQAAKLGALQQAAGLAVALQQYLARVELVAAG
jgi:HPt (histidine-containing phosphotransfer) domain-containing protein